MDANYHIVGSEDLLYYYCHFFKQEINPFPGKKKKKKEHKLVAFSNCSWSKAGALKNFPRLNFQTETNRLTFGLLQLTALEALSIKGNMFKKHVFICFNILKFTMLISNLE